MEREWYDEDYRGWRYDPECYCRRCFPVYLNNQHERLRESEESSSKGRYTLRHMRLSFDESPLPLDRPQNGLGSSLVRLNRKEVVWQLSKTNRSPCPPQRALVRNSQMTFNGRRSLWKSMNVSIDEDFKKFVESYRCRICKKDLNLDNFGGLGPNHGIFCNICYKLVR